MPAFNVIVPEGRRSSEQKTRVAVAVGRTYKELTGVPENLTQVIFIEVKHGNYFVGTISAIQIERDGVVQKGAEAVRKRGSHRLRIRIPFHTPVPGSPLGTSRRNLLTLRNERLTSAEWVRAENRPSGCRLSGREISMGKKSAAAALAELLDLIEHCREAPRPAL